MRDAGCRGLAECLRKKEPKQTPLNDTAPLIGVTRSKRLVIARFLAIVKLEVSELGCVALLEKTLQIF